MSGGFLQASLFMWHRPEPIRQASLLMVLATGLQDGVSLLDGLRALAEESKSPWRDRVTHLRIMIESGASLSDALTSVPSLLPEQTVIAIRVSESTGTTAQVLANEASRLMMRSRRENPVTKSIPATLFWMSLLTSITLGVVSFVMVFIIPKFKKIFEDFGVELPVPTVQLIRISDVFSSFWFVLAFPLVGVLAGSVAMAGWGQYQYLSRGRLLYGEHIGRYWSPMLLRLFSISITAKCSLSATLHNVLREFRPGAAATKISALRQAVDSGENCWLAMERLKLLSRREVRFIEASEKCQHEDWGLGHLASTMERRRASLIQFLIGTIVPAVILVVGALVGFICIALFLPLVTLISDLS